MSQAIVVPEQEADNRHFVAEIKRCGEKNPNRRTVELSFFVWNVNEIDVINQRFSIRFNLYGSWEEDVENITVPKNNNSSSWDESMFKWNPQIRLLNIAERIADDECWWNVVPSRYNHADIANDSNQRSSFVPVKQAKIHPSNISQFTRVRVMYCQKIDGWFHEHFELRSFPYDFQHLHIGITSSWDHKECALSFDRIKGTSISSQANISQTWDMSAPRLMAYDMDWDRTTSPLLSLSTDSATGARYCRSYLALTVSRRPGFILWNVLTIMVAVGFFSFSTYALDPLDLGDRQSVILTLVLTTVAFKFVTTSMMPEISYVTIMDAFVYACMLLQALMLLSVCISANLPDPTSFDEVSCVVLSCCWFFVLMFFLFRSRQLIRRRRQYVQECDYKFTNYNRTMESATVVYKEEAPEPNQLYLTTEKSH